MKYLFGDLKKNRGACLLLLGVAATTLIGGCKEAEQPASSPEVPRNVRVLKLAPQEFVEFFEVSGPVAPVRGTDLSAQESGVVQGLPAAKGSTVAAGDPLVVVDRDILAAEHEAAQAGLKAEAYNVDKVRRLHEAGKVSRIEMLAAEASFANAEARTRIASNRFERAVVSAPFDGVVADRYVELGQLVSPGLPVIRVIDPYSLKLEAYLTESEVAWVRVGAAADVALAGSQEPAAGTVTWVGFEADRLTGKFKVEIELPNPLLALRSGVIGRARLHKDTTTRALTIPRDAIVPGRIGPTAYVVDGDRAAQRPLTLGAGQGLMVRVTGGLNFGDRLVVRGQRDLHDGSLVRVTETADSADGAAAGDPAVVRGTAVGTRLGTALEANR